MKITHVRNATQLIEYAGKKFLIDPMLSAKGAWAGFAGTARSELRNPLVELPFSIETIVDVDAVIVTHTHQDHWDEAAIAAIPKPCRFMSSMTPTLSCCAARAFAIFVCSLRTARLLTLRW